VRGCHPGLGDASERVNETKNLLNTKIFWSSYSSKPDVYNDILDHIKKAAVDGHSQVVVNICYSRLNDDYYVTYSRNEKDAEK